MSEYDQRQLHLMSEYIKEFEQGKLKLESLIDTLEALIVSLQTTPASWKDAFESEWWTLEQLYAVALEQSETNLLSSSRDTIDETIVNMKHLLGEVLSGKAALGV